MTGKARSDDGRGPVAVAAFRRSADGAAIAYEVILARINALDVAGDCPMMGETLSVHVCKLRRKLRRLAPAASIVTLWGWGLRLDGWVNV